MDKTNRCDAGYKRTKKTVKDAGQGPNREKTKGTKMDRAAEINILKKLLHYAETKSTAMADAPWYNDVSAYTCPQRHASEEKLLIRQRPLVMGLSCDWPTSATFRTDDYAGVPILTVRGGDGKLRAFLNVCRHRAPRSRKVVVRQRHSPAHITPGPMAAMERCAGYRRRNHPFRAFGPRERD